ncbi:MAG: hypothetical protein M0Z41_05005 [Peptococcaceae bacterium]|jgi:hypothetical protein|nr:hypothetical protein [Peptococcaceae bacterium]
MEFGHSIDRIDELPPDVRNVIRSRPGLSQFESMPAGPVLIGMQLLNLPGTPLLIDGILGTDPAPYVEILNSLIDVDALLDRLFAKWLIPLARDST